MFSGHNPARPIVRMKIAMMLAAATVLAATDSAAALSGEGERRIRDSQIVSERVINGLRSKDLVRVMVAFESARGKSAQAGGKILTGNRSLIASTGKSILASLKPADFELRHRFEIIGAFAGEITANGVLALIKHPAVLRVDVDAGGRGNLGEALPLTKIEDLRWSDGLTGAGVTVAVLDSGYDSDHPDLGDDLEGEACFCSGGGGCCPGGGMVEVGAGSAEDDHGHGTNVSGIITSGAAVNGYMGLEAPTGGAPAAKIIAIKVLDENNSFCCASDVIAGLEYLINNHPEVRVVNMSLGTDARFSGNCDTATSFTMGFAAAIDALRANGVITFVSTGNDGSGVDMEAPACVENAISVGAVWDAALGGASVLGCSESGTLADQVTCFSNSSATTDLFAPGAWMTSTGMGGGASTYAGTSQAAPTAAACAALLIEDNPTRSPDSLEVALKSSSVLVSDATNGLSFPRLDCEEALADLHLCGNESLDPGEECDEGPKNGKATSCCDADCQFKPNGPASCDGSLCTRSDICTDGVCTPGPCASGESCSICGGVCSSQGACTCVY
jgi:subtilisin family serine protease